MVVAHIDGINGDGICASVGVSRLFVSKTKVNRLRS